MDISVFNGEFVLVLDREGLKIFSMMGILLKSIAAQFPQKRLHLDIVNSFVYISAINAGIRTYKIDQ